LAFFSQQLAEDRYPGLWFFSLWGLKRSRPEMNDNKLDRRYRTRAAFGPKQVTFDSATTVQDSVGTSKRSFSPDTFTVDRLEMLTSMVW
jgi:hypothetical protein